MKKKYIRQQKPEVPHIAEGSKVRLRDQPERTGEVIFESTVSKGIFWICWHDGKLDFEELRNLELAGEAGDE